MIRTIIRRCLLFLYKVNFILAPGTWWTPLTNEESVAIIQADTYGENLGTLSVSGENSFKIQIYVKDYYSDGLMVYRKEKSDSDFELLDSSANITKLNSDTYFYLVDTIPQTSDAKVYIYKFRYYQTYSGSNRTYLSEYSEEIAVPLLPSYQLSLVSPADNTVLDSSSAGFSDIITFDWLADFDESFINSNYEGRFANGGFVRTDTLKIYEVGNRDVIYSNEKTFDYTTTDGSASMNFDLFSFATPLYGKQMYWFVTSILEYSNSYTVDGITVATVESKSYPTVSYSSSKGAAQNSTYLLTIK